MGLALFSPRTWTEPASQPPLDRATVDRLDAEVRSLLDDVRRDRPGEGTEAEAAALVRVNAFNASVVRVLGPTFLRVFRSGVHDLLGQVLRRELDAAEPERKLALRHIEKAIDTFGVLTESVGAVLGNLPAASLARMFDAQADIVTSGGPPMPEPERVVPRFYLDLMVALDVLDAPLEELTFWAFRAITAARRVEAIPGTVSPAGLRGELARIRARRSWLTWDDEEIARELAPWPTPSP